MGGWRLPDAGETLCPRHLFLDGVRKATRAAAESNGQAARDAGVAGRLPQNRRGLTTRGYQFTGTGECAGCGVLVEWWMTPNKRKAHSPA